MGVFLSVLAAFALDSDVSAVAFREPCVIPCVGKMTCQTNREVRLDAAQMLSVRCDDADAVAWVRNHAERWFGFAPQVTSGGMAAEGLGDEGYRLSATPSAGIAVEAKTLQGVRHAMQTLRQVVERDSRGETVSAYRMPEFEIEDSPALGFRGLHFSWMPEQTATYLERVIRTAAAYKYNAVVIESWGVFRSERHPWFGWPDGPMTKEALRHLTAVARDLGVTLIPQINVFGHAAGARVCSGKHATLDFHPERQSLFEPSGNWTTAWNWCLSNPDAVRVVRELVVEMHEAFGNPPYFHIGCDEADGPSCASCRAADYGQLVRRHIGGICEMLERRGARAMMWHDMLLERGDPRWKGFYANGSKATVALAESLPKSVVICDWFYGDPAQDYPTLGHFSKDRGFATVTCPWENHDGIRAQGKYAREHGLHGLLQAVWNHFWGSPFPEKVQIGACAAWGRGERQFDGHFALAWRQAGWDMGKVSYAEAGWYSNQISRGIELKEGD